VLSEPKGVTQNNEKLTVKQGQQIPIQTNINNTISTQYVDAVLKLEVTPQITAEGTFSWMSRLRIPRSTPASRGRRTPGSGYAVDPNQGAHQRRRHVVIGGVVVTNQTTSVDQVPLLGSVPLIGNLFKHTRSTYPRRNCCSS
jgi:type II secretory pathway component HofQ